MSNEITIIAREAEDGTLVRVMPDGTTIPLVDRTNWDRVRAMTDEEAEAAAMADSDAQPSTEEHPGWVRRISLRKISRGALDKI